MRGFFLRLWYLLLGAFTATLVVEYLRLRIERDELTLTVSKALSIVEKTQATSLDCLNTLGNIRARLGPITEDLKNSPPGSKPIQSTEPSLPHMAQLKGH